MIYQLAMAEDCVSQTVSKTEIFHIFFGKPLNADRINIGEFSIELILIIQEILCVMCWFAERMTELD